MFCLGMYCLATGTGLAGLPSHAPRFRHGFACTQPRGDHVRSAPSRPDGLRGCDGHVDAEPGRARVRRCPLLACALPGSAVHAARASFMTERYVRDHGVYTNWAEIAPSSPTYVKALRDARLPHDAARQGAPLQGRGQGRAPRRRPCAPRLQALGFTEVIETGDKFAGATPNRYTDALRERGLLDVYRRHIADRSYQGENETGRGATKRVPMWDATPMPLPLDAYIDAWHGDARGRVDRDGTSAPSRSSCSSASRVRTIRGTRRRQPSIATPAST